MDITSFIVEGRDRALLYGDYSTYHSNLSKRLLNSRRKLGIATRNRGKFHDKSQVTSEEIAANREHVYLSLLSTERAWAQAMSMKAAHTSDQRGIVGRTRSHIISRLTKATRTIDQLAEALTDIETSGATTVDVLEAKAYASMIHGAASFEQQSWELCLRSYATCRIIYTALASSSKGDIFKDLLSETIDPSIRYAAYQLKTPRTVPINVIARKAFPESDGELVGEINKIDPSVLRQAPDATSDAPGAGDAPRTITWRSREVKIEDAQIAAAWGAVLEAKARLSDKSRGFAEIDRFDVAAAYEEVLATTQDAVDATKQAIDELKAEGVGQGDQRMQALQITRTAVNYEMIIWRIGRNRVLTGDHDGAIEEYESQNRRRKRAKKEDPSPREEKELPPSRKLAKLKEKVALYSGNLQNLQSIKELPGVAADEELATKIDAIVKYFEALSNLSIARSHAIINNVTNALALIHHSLKLAKEAEDQLAKSAAQTTGPLAVDISQDDAAFLTRLLAGELQRHRAIAHIDDLRKQDTAEGSDKPSAVPLLERLHQYPVGGVDLDNIVEFPPRMAAIPIKPIFLDVAWNYIDYPGRAPQQTSAGKPAAAARSAAPSDEGEKQQPAKRGWFGFGRS